MQIRFSMNSPSWQIEWFRNHWKAYWDLKIRNRFIADTALGMPVLESREDFAAYLKSLNLNSFLDESQIVCVELTMEEYVAAYYTVDNLE